MRLTKYLIIYLLLSFAPIMAMAQAYNGKVVDEEEHPIKDVAVALKNENGSTIAFTTTDKDGFFSLRQPEGKTAILLQFSRMGFAKETVRLSDFHDYQYITMSEETLILDEVKVKSQSACAAV